MDTAELQNLRITTDSLTRQQVGVLAAASRSMPAYMPAETVAGLAIMLASGRYSRVVEWGSGGSTLLAAGFGLEVTSVETDPQWLQRVNRAIIDTFPSARPNVHLRGCDMGPVGAWGRPLGAPSTEVVRTYVALGMEAAGPRTLFLIDGRFRLACSGSAVLLGGTDSGLLFDDYRVRPQYWPLESLTYPVRFLGHAAVFDCRDLEASEADRLVPDAWLRSMS